MMREGFEKQWFENRKRLEGQKRRNRPVKDDNNVYWPPSKENSNIGKIASTYKRRENLHERGRPMTGMDEDPCWAFPGSKIMTSRKRTFLIIISTSIFILGITAYFFIRPKYMTNAIGMKLAKIPSGTFDMGSPRKERGRSDKEGPVRKVTISKPFFMSIFEVTQGEFERVMGYNPSHNKGNKRYPVDNVFWYEAIEFCEMLSDIDTQYTYLLPTEAQWEYACRAGTKTPYYWGYTWEDSYGWYFGNSCKTVHQVGMKKPNAWGLFDMCGNVSEWCWDWFEWHYPCIDQKDPEGPPSGVWHVIRGGSRGSPFGWRSASRDANALSERCSFRGFRVIAVQK